MERVLQADDVVSAPDARGEVRSTTTPRTTLTSTRQPVVQSYVLCERVVSQMNSPDRFRLVLVALAVLAMFLLFEPFASAILAGALVAYILLPFYRRLTPRFGARIAALSVIATFATFLLVPCLVIASALLDGIRTVIDLVRADTLATDDEGVAFGELFGGDLTIESLLAGELRDIEPGAVVNDVVSLFGGFTDAFVWLVVLGFVVYYLLVDGERFARWVRARTPLPDDKQDELWERADAYTFAAIVGDISVAVIQGVLTGLALWLLGFSNALFWTLIATILAFLPFVGAPFVYVPASIYLFAVGRPIAGGFLLLFGLAIVSLSDDYLRPVIGGRAAALSPALIVVGIFGGIGLFGFLGVFYGPILLGMAKVVLEMFGPSGSSPQPPNGAAVGESPSET